MTLKPLSSAAPIPQRSRDQFKSDACSVDAVMAAAKRAGNVCDRWEARDEFDKAAAHFELGCWLHYYAGRVYDPQHRQDRIDCIRRIWEAGIHDVGYSFYSVFGFGERHFDTCFEMGDGQEVADALKQMARKAPDGPIAAGVKAMGWSTGDAAAVAPSLPVLDVFTEAHVETGVQALRPDWDVNFTDDALADAADVAQERHGQLVGFTAVAELENAIREAAAASMEADPEGMKP